MNKTVFLFGDLPMATQVLHLFLQKQNVNIVGVYCQKPNKKFTKDPFTDSKNLFEAASELNIPVFLELKSVVNSFGEDGIDIGVSARSSVIYDESVINLFKDYFINMHGGLLPARRGVNIACHAIIEGDHESGGTLHLIEKKVDSGGIIDRKSFPIEPADTAFDVFQKTQLILVELIKENLDAILNNDLTIRSQKELIDKGEESNYFNRFALEKYKQINPKKMQYDQIDRIVRGCDFPGHEPAYFLYNGRKIYLTTRSYYQNE